MNASFIELLRKLVALGPKVPAIIEKIEHIAQEVKELIELLGDGFARSAPQPFSALDQAEVNALEAELAALMSGPDSSDGRNGPFVDRIRAVLDFVRENPELIQLLLTFLR